MTNMNSNGAFLKASSHAPSATLCDFPTVLEGKISGTAIGQAVAPSCLAKSSRCDHKCHFPTWGGLHCSSKGMSSTASLSFPSWCHVDKSTSPYSTRTRVAALAYLDKQPGILTNHSTAHKRSLNRRPMIFKQRANYWNPLKSPNLPLLQFSALVWTL